MQIKLSSVLGLFDLIVQLPNKVIKLNSWNKHTFYVTSRMMQYIFDKFNVMSCDMAQNEVFYIFISVVLNKIKCLPPH